MPDGTCSIARCERKAYCRTWCSPHYNNWRRSGDPQSVVPLPGQGCDIPGCERPRVAREWCQMHYQRWQKHGDPTRGRLRHACSIDGCDKPRVSNTWCSKHLTRWKRHGSPTARVSGEVVDGRRICSACGLDKPLSAFYRGRGGRCASCRSEYHAAPERRARRAQWAEANKARMREYGRFHASLRRARVASLASVPFTLEQLDARMRYFGNKCWMCGGAFEHVDHVKPLSKNGPHILANLRPACGRCNRSKSGRWEGVASALSLAA